MDKIVIFVLCFYFCSAKITIKHLDVPASISVHENEVVLDCDFDPQGENVDSIKWFFNGTTDLIYQWLPTEKTGPQVANRLKDRIDLNYAVSDDSKTKYRAMHIKKLSPDLSGNYSCKVSGPRSEDVKTKRMIIYDPADSQLELNITEDFDPDVNVTDDEMVAISCSAQGIYPEPDLRIFISVNNGTAIEADDEDEDSDVDNSGVYDVYDVSSTVLYDIDKLPGSFDYTCELSIPGTDYVLRETRKYNRESDNDTRIESEEDYTNLFNSTNSTESAFEESQGNASLKHLPSLSVTVLIVAILGSLL